MKSEITTTPPYVPFKTFLTAIESLEQLLPNQIDRSIWPTMSGGTISQVIIAFKFFDLVDEYNQPQPDLERLVENKEERKSIFCQIFEKHYKPILSLGLSKMSPLQLNHAMQQYGISGSTLKKAISFFLQAASYAELPLAPHLVRKMRSPSPVRRKKPVTKPLETNPRVNNMPSVIMNKVETPTIEKPSEHYNGTSKTIQLRNGGNLTLMASINVFEMGPKDRDFIFGLVDALQKYEQDLNDETV